MEEKEKTLRVPANEFYKDVKGEVKDKIEFGMLCRDVLTKSYGYAIERYTWLTGCDRYKLLMKDAFDVGEDKCQTYDISRIEVLPVDDICDTLKHMNKAGDVANCKFKFKDLVQDELTGFKGRIGCIGVAITGDISCGVYPEFSSIARDNGCVWYDEGRLKMIEAYIEPIKEEVKSSTVEEKTNIPKKRGGIASRPDDKMYR